MEALRHSLENADRLISHKNAEIEKLRSDLATAKQKLGEQESQICDLETALDKQRSNSNQTTKSTDTSDLPDAADLLNRLKARRKKSTASLADVEKILEILGGDDER